MNLHSQPNGGEHENEKLQSVLRLARHYAFSGSWIRLIRQSLIQTGFRKVVGVEI